MSETNDADEAENDAENNAENDAEIDFSELSDDQRSALAEHPEVRKMLEYQETSIPQFAPMVGNFIENEANTEKDADPESTYEVFIHGIADRSGRVTPSTVHKVLNGMVEEYESVK